jgi:HTH-type transcriptional regulator, sugar sensing transcriptional regulator
MSEALAERLVRLGFSQYEARAYIGLLRRGPEAQTGYALANLTGVPQPKIYETLRRLLERTAVVQTAERPARYTAVPSDVLLSGLQEDFLARVREARDDLARLPAADPAPGIPQRLGGWEQVLAHAQAAIGASRSKVYLSGVASDLQALQPAVEAALQRGVTFVIIHFGGPLPFAVPRGSAIRHASTEGTLYPAHRSHHLAVVADSLRTVWAFARSGLEWRGLAAEDDVLATAIKGYIRHDIMIQRIYADLPQPLVELYGPGLLELANIAAGVQAQPSDVDVAV